jgi:phosphohistidine phosphatase
MGSEHGHSLVLLRHAKAHRSGGIADVDRPLAERGFEQCRSLACELKTLGVKPDLALVSAALRTVQTYQTLADRAGWDLEPTLSRDLYDGYVSEVLDAVRAAPPGCGTVMVVGHEPTMSATAHHLAGPGSDPDGVLRVRRGLPTAGVAVIQVGAPWESLDRDTAALRWLLTPLV